MTRRCVSLVAAAIFGAAAMNAAHGASCPPLQVLASVPMSYDTAGRPFIPVTLGAAHKLMLVDTGGALSEITQRVADELGLSHRKVHVRQYNMSGQYTDQAADVAPFVIGNLVADHTELMIAPSNFKYGNDGAAGIVGPNILRNYDAEFDFGGNVFKLLSQDHCDGRVIYWPAPVTAAVPMRVAKDIGHIFVPVTLDGIALTALVDTGASTTFIPAWVAEHDFHLDFGTPETPAIDSLPGATGASVFRHRFHSLSIEGIAVTNPLINIFPDLMRHAVPSKSPYGTRIPETDEPQGLNEVTLGIDVLKRLHLYIAYREGMLYATPAGDPPAIAASPPATGGETATPHTAMIVRGE
jgi:predicted aspartyl protease